MYNRDQGESCFQILILWATLTLFAERKKKNKKNCEHKRPLNMTACLSCTVTASLLKHQRPTKSGPRGRSFICHSVYFFFPPNKNLGCLAVWPNRRRDTFAFCSIQEVHAGEGITCQKQPTLRAKHLTGVPTSSLCKTSQSKDTCKLLINDLSCLMLYLCFC